jgi:hypothetical protein
MWVWPLIYCVMMSSILIKKEESVSVCELWIGDKQIRCVVLVGGLVTWPPREGDHVLDFPAERVYDVFI